MDEQIIPNDASITPMQSEFHKLYHSECWKYISKYMQDRETLVLQTLKTLSLTDGGLGIAQYQGFLKGLNDLPEAIILSAQAVDKIINDSNVATKN